LPGGACTHWNAPPCHGAHPKADIRTDLALIATAVGAAFFALIYLILI
jgi:hypothetical protein